MHDEYIIRKADYQDIPKIMKFIDDYWKKDHILAKSRRFFEYQHYYNGEVSFIIAENQKDKELEGILGYILYSEEEQRDLFGAIWKVRSNKYPMLGMKMQLYAVKNLKARTFSAIGLNPTTLDMHRRWGAVLGKMKQYYILSDREKYKIAKVKKVYGLKYNMNLSQYELRNNLDEVDLKSICDWEKNSGKIPLKSFEFVKHRYFNHPVYDYWKYAVFDGEKVLGVLIAREIECNNRKILRIIDYLGDTNAIAHIGKALQNILTSKKYEYIDFYLWGIENNVLMDAGFVERDENDGNIIPNYFEPFVQENIDLDFYTSAKGDIILCKGDGDQDRPNLIVE